LIQSFNAHAVVADKGYDSDAFIQIICAADAQAVIPSRSHRLAARPFDRYQRS
jgi:hypothetical protein